MEPGLSANTKISHYRIVSKIGAVGMGQVYRASDPKIGRDVAIKVLPADFSADKERAARFEHEAEAARALNRDHGVLGTAGSVEHATSRLTGPCQF